METRAHHLLIGGFMLLAVIGLFAFVIWLAKVDIDAEFHEYDIYFDESVAGLNRGGDVRYNGIPVGQVTRISIAPNDPSKVQVTVRIGGTVPILTDTVAVLETQGLTGVVFVQIEGGQPGSPPLVAGPGQERPVIQSRPSTFQELFTSAPDLINQAAIALVNIQSLLNEENRGEIASILRNTNELTGGLADKTDDIGALVVELRQALTDFRMTAQTLTRTADSADKLITQDVKTLLSESREMIASLDQLSKELQLTVNENRGAVSAFTSGTLPEVSRLVLDARRMVLALSRLAEKFEDNPSGVIFPGKEPEYKSK